MQLTCRFFAKTLSSEQEIQVLLPDKLRKSPKEKVPALYLLHGMYGDGHDWLRYTSLERYVRQYNVAVIMPSAENSFYQNLPGGRHYFDYVAEELPEFVTGILPISAKREESFIAGLSMGGYGALSVALQNPRRFSRAAGFSAPFDFYESLHIGRYQSMHKGAEPIFEMVKSLGKSLDLFGHMQLLSAEEIPSLFISCGKSDYVYEDFLKMREALTARGLLFFAQDGEGAHDWEYWDRQIVDLLAWLPLEKREN